MKTVHRSGMWLWLWLCSCVAAGCGDTGQHELTVPLFATGVAAEPFEVGDWTVELRDAHVGIGPIYFCASKHASADLCSTAAAELADSVELDALEPARVRVATLDALSLEVRSAAWDFAITWPPTQREPVVLDGAPEGHSAHFELLATRDEQKLEVVADIDLPPLLAGTRAVQGARSPGVIGEGSECTLHLDPVAWWSQVDFDQLGEAEASTARIAPGDRAYEALSVAMTSSSPPTATWSD